MADQEPKDSLRLSYTTLVGFQVATALGLQRQDLLATIESPLQQSDRETLFAIFNFQPFDLSGREVFTKAFADENQSADSFADIYQQSAQYYRRFDLLDPKVLNKTAKPLDSEQLENLKQAYRKVLSGDIKAELEKLFNPAFVKDREKGASTITTGAAISLTSTKKDTEKEGVSQKDQAEKSKKEESRSGSGSSFAASQTEEATDNDSSFNISQPADIERAIQEISEDSSLDLKTKAEKQTQFLLNLLQEDQKTNIKIGASLFLLTNKNLHGLIKGQLPNLNEQLFQEISKLDQLAEKSIYDLNLFFNQQKELLQERPELAFGTKRQEFFQQMLAKLEEETLTKLDLTPEQMASFEKLFKEKYNQTIIDNPGQDPQSNQLYLLDDEEPLVDKENLQETSQAPSSDQALPSEQKPASDTSKTSEDQAQITQEEKTKTLGSKADNTFVPPQKKEPAKEESRPSSPKRVVGQSVPQNEDSSSDEQDSSSVEEEPSPQASDEEQRFSPPQEAEGLNQEKTEPTAQVDNFNSPQQSTPEGSAPASSPADIIEQKPEDLSPSPIGEQTLAPGAIVPQSLPTAEKQTVGPSLSGGGVPPFYSSENLPPSSSQNLDSESEDKDDKQSSKKQDTLKRLREQAKKKTPQRLKKITQKTKSLLSKTRKVLNQTGKLAVRAGKATAKVASKAARATARALTKLMSLLIKAAVSLFNALVALITFLVSTPIGWAILAVAAVSAIVVTVVVVVQEEQRQTQETANITNQSPVVNADCLPCLSLTKKIIPNSLPGPIAQLGSEKASFTYTLTPNLNHCSDIVLDGECSDILSLACKQSSNDDSQNNTCPNFENPLPYTLPPPIADLSSTGKGVPENYALPSIPENAVSQEGEMSVPVCNALMRALKTDSLTGFKIDKEVSFDLEEFFPGGYPLPAGNDYRLTNIITLGYESKRKEDTCRAIQFNDSQATVAYGQVPPGDSQGSSSNPSSPGATDGELTSPSGCDSSKTEFNNSCGQNIPTFCQKNASCYRLSAKDGGRTIGNGATILLRKGETRVITVTLPTICGEPKDFQRNDGSADTTDSSCVTAKGEKVGNSGIRWTITAKNKNCSTTASRTTEFTTKCFPNSTIKSMLSINIRVSDAPPVPSPTPTPPSPTRRTGPTP